MDGIADFFCFEADRDACADLRRIYDARGHGRYRIFPIALTGDGRQRTLYRTNAPGGSSLFDPDTSLIRAYTDADYLYPIRMEQIETVAALPAFRQIGNPQLDLVKLDIQGCELEVLKSLGHEYLAQTVMVEVEASMIPRNVDYPTFCDLHGYMTHHNFALLDLWPDRRTRARSGRRAGYLEDMFEVWTKSPSVSARIWEVDVLFVRESDEVVESGNVAQLRKLLVCLCVYGFFAEAAHAIEPQPREPGIPVGLRRRAAGRDYLASTCALSSTVWNRRAGPALSSHGRISQYSACHNGSGLYTPATLEPDNRDIFETPR